MIFFSLFSPLCNASWIASGGYSRPVIFISIVQTLSFFCFRSDINELLLHTPSTDKRLRFFSMDVWLVGVVNVWFEWCRVCTCSLFLSMCACVCECMLKTINSETKMCVWTTTTAAKAVAAAAAQKKKQKHKTVDGREWVVWCVCVSLFACIIENFYQ